MAGDPSSRQAAPRFSFIVAAYNVGEYIEQCLHSLLSDQARDCEIILVNDGSTDDTLRRVEAFTPDPRLVVIDQPNGGLSDARNTGINQARGTYLMFVDGDDWLEADTIPQFEAKLAESPAADMLVFGFYEVYGTARYANHCTAELRRMTNSACNKLFSRELFDDVRFDKGIWYEDLAIVPYLFARADHPATLDAVLYNYRRDRETSIMNSIDFERVYDLPVAAQRCLDRIHHGEADGRVAPMRPRFGDNWEAEFLTVEIFIPGVLHRARRIADRKTRKRYISEMLRRLPDRKAIRLDVIRRQYGWKMGLGSLLYQRGQPRAAHWLLHDTGALKSWVFTRMGRSP